MGVKQMRCRLLIVTVSIFILFIPGFLQAVLVDSTWNGGEGTWFSTRNWTPPGAPNNSDDDTFAVHIDGGNSAISTVTLETVGVQVTVDSLEIDPDDCFLQDSFTNFGIDGGLVDNNGTWKALAEQTAYIRFLNSPLISGTGILDFREAMGISIGTQNGPVTIGPGQTLLGSSNLYLENAEIINLGKIIYSGEGPWYVYPPDSGFENHGIISCTGPGDLTFQSGILSNTGIIGAGEGATINFESSEIHGGTIRAAEGGSVRFTYNSFLEDVTFEGHGIVTESDLFTVTVSLTDDGELFLTRTIPFTDTIPTLVVGDGAVITGTGIIDLGDGATITPTIRRHPLDISLNMPWSDKKSENHKNTLGDIHNIGSFTHGPQHTIKGAGYILGDGGSIKNQGTLKGTGRNPLVIQPGREGMMNEGEIIADGPGGVIIGNALISDIVHISGTGKIIANSGTQALIQNAALKGSHLVSKPGGKIIFSHNTFLEDVVITHTTEIANDTIVTMTVEVDNNGDMFVTETIPFTTTTPVIVMEDGAIISGTGNILLGDNANAAILSTGYFTQTMNHSIKGAGSILTGSGGMTNLGAIIADGRNPLTISPGAQGMINKGELISQNSGGLIINNGDYFMNHGKIKIMGANNISVLPDLNHMTDTIDLGEGGQLILSENNGTVFLSGGLLTGSGVVAGNLINKGGKISPGTSAGCLDIKGSFKNENGVLLMEIYGLSACDKYDAVTVGDAAELGDTLDLRFINGFIPEENDIFTLIKYKSFLSEFEKHIVTGLPGPLKADFQYNNQSLDLVIISQTPTPTPTPTPSPSPTSTPTPTPTPVNTSPTLELLTPSEKNEVTTNSYIIRWIDEDPDDNAMISLLYQDINTTGSPVLLESGIAEDDETDEYAWNTSNVAEGVYIIHGMIRDEINPPVATGAPGSVKVTHIKRREIREHILGREEIRPDRLLFADLNSDGIINAADVILMILIE